MYNFKNVDLARMVYQISRSIGVVDPDSVDRLQLICWFSDVDWACHTYPAYPEKDALASMSGIENYYWTDGMPVSDEVFDALIDLALCRKIYGDGKLHTFLYPDSRPHSLISSPELEVLKFWINYSKEVGTVSDFKKLLETYLWRSKVSDGEKLPIRYGFLNSGPVKGSQLHELLANGFRW